ncbi:MAG TPA: alpha/beta fold hydrolase [Acidimicrobiales bacterium]|nr:alpha/beta fold hydrolase [Acidimicrobiales bacterium]
MESALERAEIFWLSTVRPDGRPHVTPLPAIWLDGRLHFCTGPGEQKAKNIEADPRCVLTTGSDRFLSGLDVVVEGSAVRVTDQPLLYRLAGLWESKLNWPYEVVDGAFRERSSDIAGAEFEGRGVAHVFAVSPSKVLAFGKGEPFSQTRYRFPTSGALGGSRTVNVDGMTMHLLDRGEGIPVILLHGGLATAAMSWTDVMPLLAGRYRVVAPDSRGHGGTDNAAGHLGYDQMADDVAKLIDVLALDRPVVVGYSDGAQVALEFGIRHPGTARALVLGGAVSEPHDTYLEGLHSWGFPSPGEVDLDLVAEEFGADFYGETRAAHTTIRDEREWVEFLRQISTLWLTVPRYRESQLGSITEPTLVIAGDRDEMAGVDQALRLYRHIPRAELAIIPDADHGAAEQPLFWVATRTFIERHSTSITPG